ncbi:PREDICTED: G2/M phase-specific E3 ubiquitin-protein ligase-like isoform X1 [Amphimedon queenslandica]|uniref:HECT-type E3 ubiquitin transferase n=1 Tax=Amphimedon queenslandica TaxID=400682 RepID=A0AAN0JRG8_AMPQE|nr:PREDICTED: G2/M phase-specific E3 ubiquitin-protein ligase-like isoform X1 [Amphimedon queenslandica]|eukprot:XP_019859447.1 PREDICTED: G2/M phase-specific E3 ubiquitin-protein ligase-like isoform X1 [Amphimedon queenslandica]
MLAQPSSLCVSPSVHAPTNVSASNVNDVVVSPSVNLPVDVSASPSATLSVMPSVYAPTAVSVSSLSSAPVSYPPQSVQVSPSISAPTNVSVLTTPSTLHPQFNDPQQEYIEILSDNSDELTIEDSNVQLAIEESVSYRLQNDLTHFDSVEELLKHHALMKCFVAVIPEDRQNIVVRRKHIWNDVKRSLKRPGFNDNIGLLINFIGEDAHDAGGPRREFFRLVMSSMSRDGNLFTGPPSNKTLTHNVIALQRNEFHICGHLIALSLLYGGPAPNFLSKSVVAYLLDEPLDTTMIEDIPDSDIQSSLHKLLDASSSEELRALFNSSEFDFRFDAGVTISVSAVKIEEKEELILAFVNNYLIYSCKGELDQFKNGLKSLGILELLQQYPTLMKPLFVYSKEPCMKATTFLKMFTIKWSPEGSNTRESEEAVIYCWTNYVHQCAGSGRQVGEVAVNLSSILIFVTGLDCIPALGFASPLEIEFIKDNDKGRLPSASTCTPALYLPLSLTDEDIFFERMDTAIIGAQMFGVP